jgi:hypothetical protein
MVKFTWPVVNYSVAILLLLPVGPYSLDVVPGGFLQGHLHVGLLYSLSVGQPAASTVFST